MSDDLRQRYAEALARWALMYPIAAWSLSSGQRAETLARNWGTVAAKFAMDVRDEELEAWRERAENAEAAIARVRRLCKLTIEASCRVEAINQARDTLAALDDTQIHNETRNP